MLVDAVKACIDAHAMVPWGATVLVAVSGGADSMALLSALYDVRAAYGLALVVVHVNHQLRGDESERDAWFVEQQAARLGLPFHASRVDVKTPQRLFGLSPQHAARQVRYEALSALQQALGASRIALGHTADDQTETLLLRFIRGGGPAGLAGMAAVRLPYIRPLIAVRRNAIMAYLQAQGVPWVEDSSNRQMRYLRNRIRHEVLPVLRRVNPRIDNRLFTLAEMLAAEHNFLEQQVDLLYLQVVCRASDSQLSLQNQPYHMAPLALQRRLLRRVIDTMLPASAPASFRHIERLRHLMVHGAVGQRLTLPGHWLAERHVQATALWCALSAPNASRCLTLCVPGAVDLPEFDMRLSADIAPQVPEAMGGDRHTAYIDLAALRLPLQVRFRRAGDRFHPLGAPGSKKLKAYLIDKKVPRSERDRVPLVINRGEIVWVVGYQLADSVKIRPGTQQTVRLRRLFQRSRRP